jgi:hypothetical protein
MVDRGPRAGEVDDRQPVRQAADVLPRRPVPGRKLEQDLDSFRLSRFLGFVLFGSDGAGEEGAGLDGQDEEQAAQGDQPAPDEASQHSWRAFRHHLASEHPF